MDAASSQEKFVEPPRNLFFGVEDRRIGGRAGLTEKYLSMEKSRRHQLAEHVINSAIQLTNAVRTMRTFDRTGNADQVLDHLNCTLEDLVKQTNNLIAEVEKSVDRYGDGLDALAARDAEEASASLNAPAVAAEESAPQAPAATAGPKPGPSPESIARVLALNAALEAQVQKNLGRALDRFTR